MVGHQHPESCLKWKDHANNLKSELSHMVAKGKYVDVKLVAEDGQFLHVHRLILHSSSKYFEDLLNQQQKSTHDKTTIILGGVSFEDLKFLVEFMYFGKCTGTQMQLARVLEVSIVLKIKGLMSQARYVNGYRYGPTSFSSPDNFVVFSIAVPDAVVPFQSRQLGEDGTCHEVHDGQIMILKAEPTENDCILQFFSGVLSSGGIDRREKSTSNKHTEMMIQLEEMSARTASLEAEVDSLRSAQSESATRFEELTAERATLSTRAANDVKRLQVEKEELQLQLDAEKEKRREEGIKWAMEKRNQEKPVNEATHDIETGFSIRAQSTKAQSISLQQIKELSAEVEALRTENQTLRASDEKSKRIIEATNQKLASHNVLVKEKATLTAQLTEAYAKIETLKQLNESANVRARQLEARLARLERINTDFNNMRQAQDAKLELSDQCLSDVIQQLGSLQVAVQSCSAGRANHVEKRAIQSIHPPQPLATAIIKPISSTNTAMSQQRDHPPAACSAAVLRCQQSQAQHRKSLEVDRNQYPCELCDYKTNRIDNLRGHLIRVHQVDPSEFGTYGAGFVRKQRK